MDIQERYLKRGDTMTRAKGIDISKWQKTFEPQGNIDFIIQKVSEGLAKDALYDELLPSVRQIERRGGYHYFRTGVDPIAQAEFFFRAQGNQGFKWLAIDYEKTNNDICYQSASDYLVCLEHLSTLTNKPIFVYTSPYLYRDNLCSYFSEIKDYLLWMAYYGDGENEPDYENDSPLFADEWTFWQWEADGNDKGQEYGVGSNDVCLDVFNGTTDDLDRWLGSEPSGEDDCKALAQNLYLCLSKTKANATEIEKWNSSFGNYISDNNQWNREQDTKLEKLKSQPVFEEYPSLAITVGNHTLRIEDNKGLIEINKKNITEGQLELAEDIINLEKSIEDSHTINVNQAGRILELEAKQKDTDKQVDYVYEQQLLDFNALEDRIETLENEVGDLSWYEIKVNHSHFWMRWEWYKRLTGYYNQRG